MQSFIVVSKNVEKRKEYIDTFCQEKNISKFDISFFQPEGTSFGIEDIRNIQKNLFVKPFQGTHRAVILEKANLLTTEAQNSLLKILEEPPPTLFIFLSSTNADIFLPTIISRCKVVILEEEHKEHFSPEILSEHMQILQSNALNEKLVLAEKLAADKENIGVWFENSILYLHTYLLENPQNTLYANLIEKLQSAYTLFQTTNVAPRFLLEHTFLNI